MYVATPCVCNVQLYGGNQDLQVMSCMGKEVELMCEHS